MKASNTELVEVDVVVPRNKVAEFVKYTNELQKEFDIRIKSFGHAGDGNLHIYILRDKLDEKAWNEKLQKVMQCMYDKSKELRGQVSGEHGIGFAKKGYLNESLSDELVGLMKGIKLTFDPKNILNPGKVCE